MLPDVAFVMTGGGARAAYQVGVLRYIASRYPAFSPGILAGSSAGAINTVQIASATGTFADAVARSIDIWSDLRMEDVFQINISDLMWRTCRWGIGRVVDGCLSEPPHAASFVDTTPLHKLLLTTLGAAPDGTLPNINRQLAAGAIKAVALTASSYATGRSVTWVQERSGCHVLTRERSRPTISRPLTVDHVMASAALPLVFPPVNVDGAWYGDGSVRLTAPLSPAIRLGANRIVVISTMYDRSGDDHGVARANRAPAADIAGMLLEAIFLDVLDADARNVRRINALVDAVPAYARGGVRHVDLLVLRPSQDLGSLAGAFHSSVPRGLRLLLRGIGGRDANLNDSLSLLMFQPEYVARLIELGEADARARASEIDALLQPAAASTCEMVA